MSGASNRRATPRILFESSSFPKTSSPMDCRESALFGITNQRFALRTDVNEYRTRIGAINGRPRAPQTSRMSVRESSPAPGRVSIGLQGGSMRFRIVLLTAVTVVGLASISGGQEVLARLKSVPLGGTLAVEFAERHFGVYVPTQFGGVLTIETTRGQVGPITGPDGRERSNGQDVGVHAQGWYTFAVSGARVAIDACRRRSYRSARAHGRPGTSTTGPPSPTRSTSPGPAATDGSTRCAPTVTT